MKLVCALCLCVAAGALAGAGPPRGPPGDATGRHLPGRVSAGDAVPEDKLVEGRGKAKYALLTNLAILLAAKVGLVKIVVGIALILGSLKFLVVLAWALAIAKHVPDPHVYYRATPLHLDHNPFDHTHYGYDRLDHNHYGYDRLGHGYFENGDVHLFYVVATKLFVLKIVYGAIFYALIVKGWHFVSWFIHYLKEKKHRPGAPYGHGYGAHHYGPVQLGYDLSGQDYHHAHDLHVQDAYAPDGYGPEYASHSYGAFNNKRKDSQKHYDADGSYSVKS